MIAAFSVRIKKCHVNEKLTYKIVNAVKPALILLRPVY